MLPAKSEHGWSRASFRIFGETLMPEELGSVLSIPASRTHMKGQRHDGGRSVWRESAWILNSPLDKKENLAEHVKWLLDRLEPKADAVKALCAKYRVDIFCGFSSGSGQGGFTLDPETLARLAQLRIPVALDLYPPSDIEDQGKTASLDAALQ